MNTSETHVLKFGGSSLRDPDCIRTSVRTVAARAREARVRVVVSAMQGVTDELFSLAEEIDNGNGNAAGRIKKLRKKHLQVFDEFGSEEKSQRKKLQNLFDELGQFLSETDRKPADFRLLQDRILSTGERASALIFSAALSKAGIRAEAFEAQRFVKTDSTFGRAQVREEVTRTLIRQLLRDSGVLPVVSGFIGSDSRGRITTLGRSGSDYTAGLVADALDAEQLEIWTDVDGVLSADPRWVPTAQSIETLSFADLGELAAHGAKVIHPKTIEPIQNKKTTLIVKNSYNPSHPGTRIDGNHRTNGSLKTITVTGPFVCLEAEDRHALPLFDLLKQQLADEPDSEAWSFTRNSSYEPARFLLREPLFDKAEPSIREWEKERNAGLKVRRNIFKVKKFSNQFEKGEQFTSRIWDLFAANGLRPLQMNRNSDERFVSFLLEKNEAKRAARLLNDYLQSRETTVDLFVAGTGAVGQTLLEQLQSVEEDDLHLRLLGACNSRKALWSEDGLNYDSGLDWRESEQTDWNRLIKRLTEPHRHNLIFVDATGSEEVARLYPKLFSHGIHVVTPSKLANTFEQSFFDELHYLAKTHNTHFQYETTVGAGLPVISTLESLLASGDTITEISGVVSGTMTYLFNQLEKGTSFSDAIVSARNLGYAEPDPRDDLSGEDVARKFLTLARTLGFKVEREELQVESLIPEELRKVNRDSFLRQVGDVDHHWQERVRSAQRKDECLRYTGRLRKGNIAIGIESVPKNSPLGQLRGTDNLIQIHSRLYQKTPLVIQGPGAGKEVTAAGVLGDILKTARKFIR